MDDWQPVASAPRDGTTIRALIESTVVWDEHEPALLRGGWRRVSEQDRVLGWKPAQTEEPVE